MPKIKVVSKKRKVFTLQQPENFPIQTQNHGDLSSLLIVLFDVITIDRGFKNSRHMSLLFLPDTEFNLNKDILSHNNVPLEKPKCTPVWEPLLYKQSKLTGKHRHKNKFKLIKLPFLSVSLIRSLSFALFFTYLTFSPHTISPVTFSLLCRFSLPPFKFFTIRLTRHPSPLNGCKLLYLHFLYF